MPSAFNRQTARLCATAVAAAIVTFGPAPPASAQQRASDIQGMPSSEFHFARLYYRNSPYARGWGNAWDTDYADAEFHVMEGISRLTRLDAAPVDWYGNGGRVIQLTDESVFDYPFLYAVEVGQWQLSTQEAARLREYLDRGGFLMVDDFWGEREWEIFVQSMRLVFPDRAIVDLPETHELLHVLYDLDQRTQIPGRGGQRAGTEPHWRGIFDDDDRLMVAINFNMDMGDAWEHADDAWYPQPMTALAYRFAVNYVIYTMTH